MEILLLGSGGPAGRPQQFCGCARCTAALATGEVRAPTAVLVDGSLLLDPGADPAQLAAAHGRSLTGLTHVVCSGPAPTAPPHWLTATATPVEDLLAPVAPPRGAGQDTWPDRWVAVRAGDRLSLGPFDIRVLGVTTPPGGNPAVGYDICGPDGRLLYGPARRALTANSLDAVAGARFDAVLLDPATCVAQLGELRRCGAVTDGTDVVAVHLTHDDPPEDELRPMVARWGVRPGRDGMRAGFEPVGAPVRGPLRTLVLGGTRSGKSAVAEQRMLGESGVTYVATGPRGTGDPEWAARVAEHRARRPRSWRTLESTDLVTAIRGARGPLLIDSLSLWLTAVMDNADAWNDDAWATGTPQKEVAVRVADLVAAWRGTRVPIVGVSDEVGSGLVPPTAAGRRFRDALGRLNALLAAESEEVLLTVAGIAVPLRSMVPPQTVTAGGAPPVRVAASAAARSRPEPGEADRSGEKPDAGPDQGAADTADGAGGADPTVAGSPGTAAADPAAPAGAASEQVLDAEVAPDDEVAEEATGPGPAVAEDRL